MKERLILVTSFEELRAGMIVVTKPCSWCGATHRAMLVTFDPNRFLIDSAGYESYRPAWLHLPAPPCNRHDGRWTSRKSVAKRVIYRVDDGLEALDKLEKSRSTPKPERVR